MKFKIIETLDIGTRLDVFVKSKSTFSRSEIQRKIQNELVLVNNIVQKNSYKLETGDEVEMLENFLYETKDDISSIKKYDIPLNIVFQDDDLIVINKPAGLTVHPGGGNKNETLVNALVHHFSINQLSNHAGLDRLGIVHRLDKDTSGLMVIAKNNKTHAALSEELKNKENFYRQYLSLCYGVPVPTSGCIERYMKKGSFADGRMIICNEGDSNARYSKTNYEVVETFCNGGLSLIRCKLETGRTHQIRLHLSDIKHSIVGDLTYTQHKIIKFDEIIQTNIDLLNGQMLHACSLSFTHPRTKKAMSFEAKLPDSIQALCRKLRK